ncbi:hypothetical protein RvY_15457-2 [Ramazzottius varieornatus]|uniref:Uncharacterized protein n=1 Tax=Ramazzottius varieornatus TaxID=947166 RepID=A0A1D1VY92_RAMVA|nr:hypothetical protein RvY_15457-2 [Ramazzottius varieornatus]
MFGRPVNRCTDHRRKLTSGATFVSIDLATSTDSSPRVALPHAILCNFAHSSIFCVLFALIIVIVLGENKLADSGSAIVHEGSTSKNQGMRFLGGT